MTQGISTDQHLLKNIPTAEPKVFVSRVTELTRLEQNLDNAFDGQGRFVIINGDIGIGKTALVQNFKATVEARGGCFVLTRFEENLKYTPYLPFIDLVKKLEELNIKEAESSLKIRATDTQTNESHLNLEDMHTISSEHSIIQQRIVSSMISHAKDVPLVVAFEDIHKATQTVWQFIHFLSDKVADQKVLLIATLRQAGRETNLDDVPVYSDIIQRMNRDGLIEKILLERFSKRDIREYLRKKFLKTDFTNNFLPNLYEISGGVPAQLVKYVSALLDRKQVYQQNGVWFNAEDIDWEELITVSFSEFNLQRMLEQAKELPEDMQNLLNTAAILQSSFSPELISAANATTKMKTLKFLHKLESQKYLVMFEDGSYQFRDIGMRSALREQISDDQKKFIHKQIAVNIEQSENIDPEKKNYHLAYHYRHTTDHRAAFKYLTLAADQAIRNFAFSEARSLHQNAFDLKVESGEGPEMQRMVHFHLEAAWLDRVLGFYEDSLKHTLKAEEIYGDDIHDKTGSLIKIEQSFTYFRLNNWDRAKTIMENCLVDEDKVGDFENSMANYGLGNINFELCNYEEARRYYNRSLEMAERINSKSLTALILNNLGAIENVSSHHLRAIANYSKAIPIYEESGNKSGLARVYNNIGMTYADMQDWKQANQFYGQSLSVSDVMGLLPLKSITFLNRALALAQLNELDQAREYSFKASRLLTQLNDELGMAEYHKIRAVIYLKEHNWLKAEEHFDIAFRKFDEHDNRLGCSEIQYERALMEISRQQPERAREYFKLASESFAELGLVKKVRGIEKQIKKLQDELVSLQAVASN